MACLNKLAIRGIRSFDDKQISIIEFFSPVTVIVGHNGSGKTTIIECLKYATTGEQPPNTRGGAFVHDPKMANEKEVKAQVKLRFNAANGTRMLAVRNLSVTVKKTSGLTMKTLESILALADGNVEKGGKRGVISTKCAEMDAEIPQLLGVSKAVLENVIFCHQEDSYWPLAEASTLKKKFDDIFEATRYTKALDNIKALRKDRVAELKAEKERLVSLSREKQHLDKLKGKIKDQKGSIATKEIEYENAKAEFDSVAKANREFYDKNAVFRELYKDIAQWEERKDEARKELENARNSNFEELPGTDEELTMKMGQFNQHIERQRQALLQEERRKQDIEDEIVSFRDEHTDLLSLKGKLSAEADAQKARIMERESLLRDAAKQYSIPVSEQKLERDAVAEVVSRLQDAQRRQKSEFERIQTELSEKSDEYHSRIRKLENEAQAFKTQRQSLRDSLQERQTSIRSTERQLDGQSNLEIALQTTQDEIKEKRNRVDKLKVDIAEGKHEEKIQEKTEQARRLDENREALLEENRVLNMQASSRAKLDLNRAAIKSKTSELETAKRAAALRFEELTKQAPTSDNIDKDVDRVLQKKEYEQSEADRDASMARSTLQNLETSIVNVKSEIRAKQNEVREYDTKISQEIGKGTDEGFESLDQAISESKEDLEILRDEQSSSLGSVAVYEKILNVGKQKNHCLACNRAFEDDDFAKFTAHVKGLIAQEGNAKPQESVEVFENQHKRYLDLKPIDIRRGELVQKEIPALKARLAAEEEKRPSLASQSDSLAEKLEEIRQLIKNLDSLKQQTISITRLNSEIERLKGEASDLETELSMTGSTRTTEDVQNELDDITAQLRGIEKEKSNLIAEKDRLNGALRAFESKCHQLELDEQKSLNKINELKAVSERQEIMKKEIMSFQGQIKELDAKISAAQGPIQALEGEHKRMQDEFNAKLTLSQTRLQELNMVVDRIMSVTKQIERYVKEKRGRNLDDCLININRCEEDLNGANDKLEDCRTKIKGVEKEISDAGASNANLRENIRIRKLRHDIGEWEKKIAQSKLVDAADAKQTFEKEWPGMKAHEARLNTEYNHLGGELSSMRAQLKSLEHDMKEFKDINKDYTDQLIRVKIADMANNDLEKYAKALDNAIMKYHGLKMEEVNDTMKHLWNKTYQGTDIDGIKIKSDVEGGASKRSYNYRVVMTKDQVEMDMRGRCSAGQKMLASIIIRLALSDSFGQNCGILALDEPTNALDTENIDALAESLVDIINERKSHANFQLIIITHDENFLRKLGQANVMENYWRVVRDSRQKSIIERQRFR